MFVSALCEAGITDGKTVYNPYEGLKNELLKKAFHAKVEIGRVKGLGEMMAS
jgi:DNA gyrase/topoisomerase IV subunit B